MTFEFGDVVVLKFPFTDGSAAKQRPAVVVSSNAYNSSKPDIVVAAVTSKVERHGLGEYPVVEWRAAGLLKASVLKPVYATLESENVVKTLGRLAEADIRSLNAMIAETLGG